MLNKYPWWKYLIIGAVLGLGLLYSLPNLYPDDPAIQISGNNAGVQITDDDLAKVTAALANANIAVKASEALAGKAGLVRLTKLEDQLLAQEIARRILGDDFIVALNLAPNTPAWLRKIGAKPMKLGLDLSGGVHFLLEVDMDKALDARLKVYESEIKALLRENKVRYASMPLTNQIINLSFADAELANKAQSLLRSNFADFDYLVNDKILSASLKPAKHNEIRDYSISQNLITVRNRVNELGVAEPLVQRQGSNRIVVELPGVQDTAEAKRILGKTASLEFRLEAEPNAPRATTEFFEFRDERRPPVALERNLILTGDQVTGANASFDERGRPEVNIRLDNNGGNLINRATRGNVGRNMAVVFIEQRQITRYVTEVIDDIEQEVAKQSFKEDKKIISLATIQSALGNQFRITGLNSSAESSELALLLRAGGLAAPMYFVEERTIGPSLGAENIVKGITSTWWALIFVAVFVVIIYKFFGVLATVALGFNLVLLVGLMSMISATLTLPGIAGIVLTLGMAVDANVLIYSRIREELNNGLSVQRAIHEGFDRAYTAIIDSNLTTLLVGAILFALGTGPIKGFAVTLSLGILTSLFTAIMFTRGMVNFLFGGRNIKKLWI